MTLNPMLTLYDEGTFTSILDPLKRRYATDPDSIVYHFWTEDNQKVDLTVRDLWHGMTAKGQALHDAGIRQDDLVILVLNHSVELLYALFGAVYIGAVPSIFPYFSSTHDPETYRNQVCTLVAHAEARAVVTSIDTAAPLAQLLADTGCAVLGVQAVSDCDVVVSPDIEAATHGEATAVIQYTSGTTGLKKGVMLSHRAILHVVYEMIRYTYTTPDDVLANWLPLYHDYGLFCGLFCPTFGTMAGVLISPYKWVRRPALLFEAIDQYGVTMCWMPNFAMNHSVKAIRKRQIEGMNLSSVRALMSGAEPIRHQSQQAFIDRFAPYGFQASAMCAGYGMAENTLAVTITPPNLRNRVDWIDIKQLHSDNRAVSTTPDSAEATAFVSCGFPFGNAKVAIKDETGRALPDRTVGNIFIKSQSLFSGYRGRPDDTAKVLQDGWYATGDVGYVAEGELFVCSRKKDIIIVRGKNFYPKDIEAIARKLPEVKDDGVVAFGVTDHNMGSEGIAIVCEMQRKLDETRQKEVSNRLRKMVTEAMGISLADARVVGKGWVVKTQNAKISRSKNREKYHELFRQRRRAAAGGGLALAGD